MNQIKVSVGILSKHNFYTSLLETVLKNQNHYISFKVKYKSNLVRELHISKPDIIIIITQHWTDKEIYDTIDFIHNKNIKMMIITENQTILSDAIEKIHGLIILSSHAKELWKCIEKMIAGEKYISPKYNNTSNIYKRLSIPKTIYETLTQKERNILDYLVLNYSNKEIASKCFISTATIAKHIEHITHKLKLEHVPYSLRHYIKHNLKNSIK